MTLHNNEIRVITPNTEYTYTIPETHRGTQLQALQYLIQHNKNTKKQATPKKDPHKRLSNKQLTKLGIVGMGRERYIQAIKLGHTTPIHKKKEKEKP